MKVNMNFYYPVQYYNPVHLFYHLALSICHPVLDAEFNQSLGNYLQEKELSSWRAKRNSGPHQAVEMLQAIQHEKQGVPSNGATFGLLGEQSDRREMQDDKTLNVILDSDPGSYQSLEMKGKELSFCTPIHDSFNTLVILYQLKDDKVSIINSIKKFLTINNILNKINSKNFFIRKIMNQVIKTEEQKKMLNIRDFNFSFYQDYSNNELYHVSVATGGKINDMSDLIKPMADHVNFDLFKLENISNFNFGIMSDWDNNESFSYYVSFTKDGTKEEVIEFMNTMISSHESLDCYEECTCDCVEEMISVTPNIYEIESTMNV